MAYEKKSFTDGIVLSAEHLNHMEQGIEGAHNIIGTGDISGIGDGTVKGAILALKAMIESGGSSGDSSGEAAAAFTVSVLSEDNYGEAPTVSIGEGGVAYLVSDKVPTLAQMQGCSFSCNFGEVTLVLNNPNVEEQSDGYWIYFTTCEETTISTSFPPVFIPKKSSGNTMGVYVCFDACDQAYSSVAEDTMSLSAGTISFPEV